MPRMTGPEAKRDDVTAGGARGARVNLLILLLAAAIFARAGAWESWRKESTDLPSFYLGARLACFERVSPYDRAAWDEAARSFPQGDVFPYLYPPPSLVLFAPLPLLPYPAAKGLMLLLNLALIAAFLPLLLSRLLELPRGDPLVALAVVYVFAAAPVRANLEHGQVNLAVLALIAAAWLGLKRERGGALAAALPLSLAILLKTYPAVALAYLALQRRFRVVGMTCALLLGFSLVSLALVPASAWGDWFRNVLPTTGYGMTPAGLFSPAAPWNQSLNGFTARLFSTTEFAEAVVPGPAAARVVPYLLAAAVLIVSGRLWRGTGAARGAVDGAPREMAHVLAVMVLIAPFSWEHHLVYLLPAVILLAWDLSRAPRPGAPALLAGLGAIVLALPIRLASPALVPAPLSLLISVKLYAALALWLHLTLTLRARRTGPSAASSRTPV